MSRAKVKNYTLEAHPDSIPTNRVELNRLRYLGTCLWCDRHVLITVPHLFSFKVAQCRGQRKRKNRENVIAERIKVNYVPLLGFG